MVLIQYDDKSKLWTTSRSPVVHNRNLSVGHILLRSLKMFGPKVAQISITTGIQYSFEEFRMMTIRAAQNLRRRRYDTKSVVSIIARNVDHLAPILSALLCLGGPVSPIDFSSEKQILLRVLQQNESKLIFCEVGVYDLVVECLTELKIAAKIFTFNGSKGVSEGVECLFVETGEEEHFLPTKVDGNDFALIMNTSGSTGPSKGVPYTHATIISDLDYEPFMSVYLNAIIFGSASIYWVSGIYRFIMGMACGSTHIITSETLSPESKLRVVEQYKVTLLDAQAHTVLQLFKSEALHKTNLSSVKYLLVGSSKIPFHVMHDFDLLLPNGAVIIEYGLTEVGDISIGFPKFSGKDDVGRLIDDLTVKIVDENDNRCGVGVDGEICVKTRYDFPGYYKNQRLTDIAVDNEGFFKTGDIGHIDVDGYVYIVSRKKEVISQENEWIYPSEIEEVLLKSSDIKNVYVVGVPIDEVLELPAAVVERAKQSKITEEDIAKLVTVNLPDNYKLRGGIYFMDTIPLSDTGKPLRNLLKEVATKWYQTKMQK